MAHAQRTRSFIISLVVRQILHRRIRLAEYLGSSMAAALQCRSGGSEGTVGMGVVAKA
jgi:hypothetical protein